MISSPVKLFYSVLHWKMMARVPATMNIMAVKSYCQMKFSPSTFVDKMMLAMIAVAQLHEISVRSTKGRTTACVIVFDVTRAKPMAHLTWQ